MAKEPGLTYNRGLVIRLAGLILIVGIITLSCHKELSCEGCVLGNQPPLAVAGQNVSISLPFNSLLLDGSLSTDPDGTIMEWHWKKISGPDSFYIQNSDSAITNAHDLVAGVYQFELTVTDDGGLQGRDTLRVDLVAEASFTCTDYRPVINTRLVPLGTLSEQKRGVAVGTAGNKIVFAGGRDLLTDVSTASVDIYDVSTKRWSTAQLSGPREQIAVAIAGTKIFFAGGWNQSGTGSTSNKVDIYDASNNTWTSARMSVSRSLVAATVVGNKVIFAGGFGGNNNEFLNTVDIYDLSSNDWSTSSLSEARGVISAVTAGNKVYFAGGRTNGNTPSSRIDIYDNSTNAWSTASLDQPKSDMCAMEFEGRIYWAGGLNNENKSICEVEILNLASGSITHGSLSHPIAWFMQDGQSTVFGNKLLFLPGSAEFNTPLPEDNKIDIYDVDSKAWSVTWMERSLAGASIISVQNKIYIVGGKEGSNQVLMLEF